MSSSLTNEPFRNRYSSVRSANFAVAGTSSERNWPIRRGYASRAEVVSRAQSTERFNLPPIRNIRNSISSSPSLGDHSQTSEQSCEEEASDLTTELSVRIVHREIHVRTGELVTITSSIHSEEAEVDVKWYNGEKEISNSGRYRLSGKGSQYYLEIFDCDVADRGEISCLAISSTSVASDSVQLFIHEEDMAGEEPMFIEPLTFEQNGMSITLRCSVIGYPIPYLTFHRRNRRIPSDTHIGTFLLIICY
ncbi:unnamed protein product [Anisakis simplex]|uniref:IG domain-containing protein n=1 Tax=Anisakis simplex TaxID=6269 RepID=A0A0M3J261_ANISI|nr:unnamed protein product [Anisakis simplex]